MRCFIDTCGIGGYGIGIAFVLNVAASWLEMERRTGGGGLKGFTAGGSGKSRCRGTQGVRSASDQEARGLRFGLWRTQSIAASLDRNVCQGSMASGLRAGEH